MRRLKRAIKFYYYDYADGRDPFLFFNEEQKDLSEEVRASIWNVDTSNLPPRRTVPYLS